MQGILDWNAALTVFQKTNRNRNEISSAYAYLWYTQNYFYFNFLLRKISNFSLIGQMVVYLRCFEVEKLAVYNPPPPPPNIYI